MFHPLVLNVQGGEKFNKIKLGQEKGKGINMLEINKAQINKFSLKEFEDDMVDHVKEFFPNHFMAMQETATRNTIRYAIDKASLYDFISQRNVCLFLNSMLVLGSHFDSDPQYPWAQEIILDEKINDPKVRADRLADKTERFFESIRGPQDREINRSLLYIFNNSELVFNEIMKSGLNDIMHVFNKLYQKKIEMSSGEDLNQLIKSGKQNAAAYGISSESNVVLFMALMFMKGAGFHNDPQFPRISDILNDKEIANQNTRTKLLFDAEIANLKQFLSKN